jgi:LytS/YehU family sensor histidine kinase
MLAAAVAALTLGWLTSSQAGGGELLDIELPSMRTPIESTGMIPERTRAEVREALKMARAQNLLTPTNEIGDTAEVLAQREIFYALQTEVMEAEQRRASLAQAEVKASNR